MSIVVSLHAELTSKVHCNPASQWINKKINNVLLDRFSTDVLMHLVNHGSFETQSTLVLGESY